MLFTPKHIGIDIGSSAVRIADVKKRRSGFELQDYLVTPLPVGAVANGNVLNIDAVALAIQEALRKSKISVRNAVLSIDTQNVVIRHIKFPKMKEEELNEALKWELDQYIPMAASEAVVDFEIVNETEEEGVNQMDVMLVVAAKKVVQGYVEAVVKAGLNPVAVDVEPLSIGRVIASQEMATDGEELAKDFRSGAIVLIDMGAGSTKIIFFRQGNLQLSRIVNLGGYDITKAIATRLRVTLDQAEEFKKEYGFIGIDKLMARQQEVAAAVELDNNNHDGLSDSGREVDLAEEIKPKIDEIIDELKRSLDFYKLQYRHEFVNKIVLTGGSALLKGLPQYIEAQTGVKVFSLNPLETVSFKSKNRRDNIDQIAPTLSNAIGLAIREVKGK